MKVKNLPPGFKDKLFRQAQEVYDTEIAIHSYLIQRGFQRMETPIIEFAEIFQEEMSTEACYRFFDANGRLLVLRPDMTLPVGRMIASTKVIPPLKLMYLGKVFRFHDDLLGEKNEFLQAGIELIGYPSKKAEIEAIVTAYELFDQLEIGTFHMELGHAKIFQLLVTEAGFTKEQEQKLEELLQNRNLSGIRLFSQQVKPEFVEFILALPRLFGHPIEVIEQSKKLLPKNSGILTLLTEIEQLVRNVSLLLPPEKLQLDLAMLPTMNYYSGLLFSAVGENSAETILSGGRYQHENAEEYTAVGWAVNVDILAEMQMHQREKELPQPKKLLFYQIEELQLANHYANDPDVQLSLLETLEKTRQFAKDWQFEEVWYFENGELIKEKAGVEHD